MAFRDQQDRAFGVVSRPCPYDSVQGEAFQPKAVGTKSPCFESLMVETKVAYDGVSRGWKYQTGIYCSCAVGYSECK